MLRHGAYYMMLATVIQLSSAALVHAADAARPATPPPAEGSKLAPESDPKAQTRNFYQVLEDVVADFEFDMKNGAVGGLKELSIRNVVTSENIPPSFKTHIELLVSEKIIKNSRTRIIQCLQCRSKKATLSGDNVVVTSPDTNQAELTRIAKQNGIMHFMDIAFAYQPTGMILSMSTMEPESGAIVWSKSYNSETSRAAAFRRGVDYSQVEEARTQTTYTPAVQYRAVVYYLFERDLAGYAGTLGLGFRMVERYDNRKKEVGFEIDYLANTSALTGGSKVTGQKSLYSGVNLTMLFIHAWNFIGPEENYNLVRGSFFSAIGGTYASGFLGGLVRVGYEWRLAKHWGVSANLGYRPPGTAFIAGEATAVSGAEFGVGISALF